MADTLSVLVVGSEAAPFAQTGGLAEVVGSLPLALKDAGCRVAVVLPAYRQIMKRKANWDLVSWGVPVRVGDQHLKADILSSEFAPDIPLYLIRRDEYFDRSELYGGTQGEYFDNPERFTFFSRAIPALCPNVGFVPDVILCNDWQTGLVAPLLDLGALPRTATVFSIHNMGYLGLVPVDKTHVLGLPDRYYSLDGLEYFGQMSMLKGGIVYANAVTTVSPTYAREIQTPEGGRGLDGLMRHISGKLFGILNGVDYSVWNPAVDKYIPANYSPDDLSGKLKCKKIMLEQMGLDPDSDDPVIGMVTRLTGQKGFNLVADAAEKLFKQDCRLVVLGTGEPYFEDMLQSMKSRYPDRIGMRIGFDVALSHLIVAGADMFLMPSLYEPCGLSQMYSLKYGAVPIVRKVGGLNDSVRTSENGRNGNGFKFNQFDSSSMLRAIRDALNAYKNREKWKEMMLAGMAEDFSWRRSAGEYIKVFEKAIADRRKKT